MKYEEFKALKAGDKVIMKPTRSTSSTGYAVTAGKILTIKEILPQYAWACTFEETDADTLFRMQDILKKA